MGFEIQKKINKSIENLLWSEDFENAGGCYP